MLTYQQKIDYIDNRLDFYFENGIASPGAVGEPSLTSWCSVAFLYYKCTKGVTLTADEKDNIFSLLEDYFTSAEIEVKSGENVADMDIGSIGYGFDFNIDQYQKYLTAARAVVEEHGVDLIDLVALDIES